jgi:lysophospholipid acyltransferase (LPLAT)-like uncharacterized protein
MKIFFKEIKNIVMLYIAYILLRVIFTTYKIKLPDNFKLPNEGFIYAFWHRKLFGAIPIYKKMKGIVKNTNLMITTHKDGELLSRVTSYFGFSQVRGSSTRDGLVAFKKSIKLLANNKVVAITPDGPRGPIYNIPDGFIAIAWMSKCKVVNLRYNVSNYWKLNTWDMIVIPKPFSTITVKCDIIDPVNISKIEFTDKLKSAMREDI